MYLNLQLSRIIKEIEKGKLESPKKEYIQRKWFSNLSNEDINDFSNYLNLFF
jgi:hypothetical protein